MIRLFWFLLVCAIVLPVPVLSLIWAGRWAWLAYGVYREWRAL